MKILRLLFVLALMATLMAPATAMAKTLAGEKYGFALLGAKDYDDFADPALNIRLGYNIPINDDLDITPFFNYESLDSDTTGAVVVPVEYDAYTLAVRGDYFITEKRSMKIYAGGGFGLTRTEATACVTVPIIGTVCSESSDNDLYFQAHGGLDMDLGDNMGLRPECAYTRIGDEDDVICGAMLNLELGSSFNLLAEAKLFIDNRELFYSIGGAFTF